MRCLWLGEWVVEIGTENKRRVREHSDIDDDGPEIPDMGGACSYAEGLQATNKSGGGGAR